MLFVECGFWVGFVVGGFCLRGDFWCFGVGFVGGGWVLCWWCVWLV